MRNMGRPVTNKYKVPVRAWTRWTNARKSRFNRIMYELRPSMQFAFTATSAPPMSKEHWGVLRFNLAWLLSEME